MIYRLRFIYLTLPNLHTNTCDLLARSTRLPPHPNTKRESGDETNENINHTRYFLRRYLVFFFFFFFNYESKEACSKQHKSKIKQTKQNRMKPNNRKIENNIYSTIDSCSNLPSFDASSMSVSWKGWCLEDLDPLMHKMAECNRAKLRQQRSHPIYCMACRVNTPFSTSRTCWL